MADVDVEEGRDTISAQQYTLLEEKRNEIESIKRATYDYGATEVHKLDVYTPPLNAVPELETNAPLKPPILMFFYGGGFTRGARIHPRQELVNANLGAFFALRGILTVIVDYRLVPSVTFPGGSEDVHDALVWVSQNLGDAGDTARIFIMGHSAGGIHAAGCFLSPSIYTKSIPVRGIILLGVPYEIPIGNKTSANLWRAAEVYYGGAKKVAANQPLGLLRRLKKDWLATLPPLRNMMAAKEPRYISGSVRTFGQLYAAKGGTVQNIVLTGHDHASPVSSLCSGEREDWAIDVTEWIRGTIS